MAAVAVLATAGPLAWSRNLGGLAFAFLLMTGAGLVTLLAICASFFFWARCEKGGRRRSIVATAVIVALSPAVFIGMLNIPDHVRDRVEFLLWYPFHRRVVDQFAAKNGIIVAWAGWGIAGLENDSYLVSNPSDTISSPDAASIWAKQYAESDCEIVAVTRLKRGLYILTTFNCSLQ